MSRPDLLVAGADWIGGLLVRGISTAGLPRVLAAARTVGRRRESSDGDRKYLKWNAGTIQRLIENTDRGIVGRAFWTTVAQFLATGRGAGAPRPGEVRFPRALVGEITGRCNLRCAGCYSRDRLVRPVTREVDWHRILGESQALGIHTMIWTGGEPLLRADQIFELAHRYPAMRFGSFTNGTLIDDGVVRRARAARNLFFILSLDGPAGANDSSRGGGGAARVHDAARRLRSAGVPFGFSITVRHGCVSSTTSDEFVSSCVREGASFLMYFPFIPVAVAQIDSFGLRPAEKEALFGRVADIVPRHRISAFFSHLNLIHCGCAGGARISYINAYGDVQPCPFTPFTTANVHDMPLRDALQCALNRAYARAERTDESPLARCHVMDHPEELAEILRESGARAVDGADSTRYLTPPPVLVEWASDWRRLVSMGGPLRGSHGTSHHAERKEEP